MNSTAIRRLIKALGARRAALRTGVCVIRKAITDYGRYLPCHLRRGALHSTRGVERAVIEQWLIWRA